MDVVCIGFMKFLSVFSTNLLYGLSYFVIFVTICRLEAFYTF